MTITVDVTDLHVHHGETRALDGADLHIRARSLCGLFGRNGAGKTTLLTTLAAFQRPTSGLVQVGGRDPYEDPATMAAIGYVPAARKADDDLRVREVVAIAEMLRPTFDRPTVDRLLARFDIDPAAKACKLSTGQRSAFTASIGLAARTPLTLFDEVHLGMDAVARAAFYEELLAEYAAHPRTMVISTHLIDEVSTLVDDVVILHHGRVMEHRDPDALRAMGARVSGPTEAVEAALARVGDHQVLARHTMGRASAVTVLVPGGAADLHRGAGHDTEVEPLPLQDLFVNLTAEEVLT
jgi:ABC-2 type transport system ATP-binding protein